MAKQTVAEQFVDTLVRAGVERIYGVVGDSLNPVVDAIRRNAASSGSTSATRRRRRSPPAPRPSSPASSPPVPGRCGPGNLHLINGLFDAHRTDGPGARAGLAHPQQRDRHRLLPGDPPGPAVHRMQPLQRDDLQPAADAPGPPDGHPARGRPAAASASSPLPGDVAPQPAPDTRANTRSSPRRPPGPPRRRGGRRAGRG